MRDEDEIGQTKQGLSRRDVLKGTAGVIATAGLLGVARTGSAEEVKKWNMDADVIVLGAGGGGLMAAVEAATAKAKVILLESMPTIGGSTVICGGSLVFAGTDFQREKGVSNDSNELLYKDFMEAGRHRNLPGMVKVYVDNQLDTYERLKQLGVKFYGLIIAEGSVPRIHRMKPPELIGALKKEADRLGVQTMLETPATKLIRNPAGRIIGVKAKRADKEIAIRARKGVVVATGGFSNNPEMLENFRINFSKVRSMAGPGSKGDGIKMLWHEGAYMVDLPSIKATFSVGAKSKPGELMWGFMNRQGAIIVNKLGKRFVDESMGHKEIPDYVVSQPDGVAYLVFDSKIAPAAAASRGNTMQDLEKWMVKGETIEAVAKAAGIPEQTLKETVERYNNSIESGKDAEFGRKALSGAIGKPVKIQEPPFYVFEGISVILGTYCGALTNNHAQVLDVYGQVIPGLYAAGEVLGGVHGDGYIGGTAAGKALIFGRLAGGYAAKEKSV